MLWLTISLVPLPVFAKKSSDSSGGSHAVKGYFKKDGKEYKIDRYDKDHIIQKAE